MLFHRTDFLVFLAIVYVGYRLIGPHASAGGSEMRHRAQNVWLLAASYVFYGMWDYRFLSLLFGSTLIDFLCGWGFKAGRLKSRTAIGISVATNLGILGVMKYADFFLDSFAAMLATVGFHASFVELHIILPVGISFYTFQSMAYTVDVVTGRSEACCPSGWNDDWLARIRSTVSSFVDFALYVSFFPQLVAGPIERSRHMLGQIQKPRILTSQCWSRAAWLFSLGLFMKLAIADEIAPQVDAVFDKQSASSLMSWYVATIAFALQIYGDFAGYSLMARGIAALLGFELTVNFRQPYLASSFSDFWRRWHISLSTWIRDYLYIPLGGSRGSRIRTIIVLMATMGIAGLWHGATWAFVCWGLLHGAFLAFERITPIRSRREPKIDLSDPALSNRRTAPLLRITYGLIVLHGVLLGWLLFRAGNLPQAIDAVSRVWERGLGGSSWLWNLSIATVLPYLAFLTITLLYELPCRLRDRELFPRDFAWGHRFCLYTGLGLFFLASGGQRDAAFIYFQF